MCRFLILLRTRSTWPSQCDGNLEPFLSFLEFCFCCTSVPIVSGPSSVLSCWSFSSSSCQRSCSIVEPCGDLPLCCPDWMVSFGYAFKGPSTLARFLGRSAVLIMQFWNSLAKSSLSFEMAGIRKALWELSKICRLILQSKFLLRGLWCRFACKAARPWAWIM